MTKSKIEEQELADTLASYQEVCPDAVSFEFDDDLDAAIEALGDDVYDESFGRTYVNTAVVGYDAEGEVAGYVLSVTSSDGYDGDITLSVGLTTDGTVIKLAFTTLTETAGMGMRVDEDSFKGQFEGVSTDAFVLNKSGDSTEDNEIDTISGASTSSGAVVNAVNTALAFFAEYIG
ncbi:MAG: FMN-binding protein [Lachnospiraceae bacterium]|nr:FMN-binding protein [Lachnospiraceae bacterium]